jgi:protein-disulfide isomerase
MTHFENEEKNIPEKEHENNEHNKHSEHHKNKQHKEEKTCCKEKWELNGFQKFLAVAVVIQVLLLLFVAVKISALSGIAVVNDDVANVPTLAANPNPTNNAPTVDMTALIGDNDIRGDEDAPVTIIEFSDYECPFCTKFYNGAYQQIKTKYIETGKVKFVYRDFPLGFHQNAQKAAEAAECAGEQGKYFEMHDLLFEKGVVGGVSAFKTYAKEIKLNTNKFDTCLDSGAMASEVQKDMIEGQQAGVTGTPGFFINGKELVGAQPFAAFEQIIEQELNS